MSNSDRLSKIQKQIGGGRKLIESSFFMDNNIKDNVVKVIKHIENEFNVKCKQEKIIFLKEIVEKLKNHFPDEKWHYLFDKSFMKPDGGIIYLLDKNKNKYPILITEMKKQGTNDKVITETGKKQASGNAIERLGKNVIGFRTWLSNESIFPFICFGWGWDFKDDSSILDRIVTIAEFGELNVINLLNTKNTNRGSFFFRQNPLTKKEMYEKMINIAERSVHYYFSKYGKNNFC